MLYLYYENYPLPDYSEAAVIDKVINFSGLGWTEGVLHVVSIVLDHGGIAVYSY